jgi:hypothetical protein
MSVNRGKTIEDMQCEIMAERAYQKHLDPAADKKLLMASRKRVTALGTAIAKQNAANEVRL